VKRDVIEVVTPGANFSEKLLDHKSNNYLACIYIKDKIAGFSFCDISTGEFSTCELTLKNLEDQLNIISPAEILYPKKDKDLVFSFLGIEKNSFSEITSDKYALTKIEDWVFNFDYAVELITNQFKS